MFADLQLQTQLNEFKQRYHGGVVVAVSGGCDSMALLALLVALRDEVDFILTVLHINFQLRGAEAEQDQRHVQATAQLYGLPCYVYRTTAADFTLQRGRSTQEWARLIRQRELRRHCNVHNCVVALAHHRDDLAETALYRLSRGVDVAQLPGMVCFNAPFWRPLLTLPQTCLHSFCVQQGIAYRTDSSNRKNVYARNRLRHLVMPQLATLHRDAPAHIIAACQQAQELHAAVEQELRAEWQTALQRGELSTDTLQKLPHCKAKILLRLLLGAVSQRTVTAVLAQTGRGEKFSRQLKRNLMLISDGTKLKLQHHTAGVKVARKQQYAQIMRHTQACFILEPGACAETTEVKCAPANATQPRSVCYRLHRPTQREKVRWRGQRVPLRTLRDELPRNMTLYVCKADTGKQELVNTAGECLV